MECMTKMDFCRSDAFGHRGELFACEWGTLAPLNTPRDQELVHRFKVIRVDVKTGTGQTFLAITFPVVNEKSTQQLLLQEYMLEMAAKSILYKANI